MPSSVMWPPIVITTGDANLIIRVAMQTDAPTLAWWDADPDVIACATDDPNAEQAFRGAVWSDEIAANSDATCYYIAELDGRPIGAMQVIDPRAESTHYWGECEPNLRAIDIWIGDASDRNKGYGALMMGAVIDACFADPAIAAIIIDPLNSNTEAHRFYQRLGFKPIGRRLFNGEDDCLVHRLERADWRGGN
jgi:aminoglycoside 6'-N-acetyltransferase